MYENKMQLKNKRRERPSRWWRSKTWRSLSSPQIYQKYIYMWNNTYRTPTERWQKTSDFPKDIYIFFLFPLWKFPCECVCVCFFVGFWLYSFAFPFVLGFCLFFFFFTIVFSACYHWWICFLVWLLSSFFLFFITF